MERIKVIHVHCGGLGFRRTSWSIPACSDKDAQCGVGLCLMTDADTCDNYRISRRSHLGPQNENPSPSRLKQSKCRDKLESDESFLITTNKF